MKIMFITHAVDQTLGGVSRVTMALAKEFVKRGHSCSFICWQGDISKVDIGKVLYLSPDYDKEKFIDNAIEFAKETEIEYIINQDNYHSAVVRFLNTIKTARKVKIINVLHISPDFICHIKHKGIKTKIKNLIYYIKFGMGILKKQRKDMYNLSDKFVLLSPSYIEPFMKIYHVNDKAKIHAIANPIPLDYIAGNIKKKREVLIVSRLEDNQKRITTALRIWKEVENSHPDWNLVLAGYGEDEKSILNYAHSLNLKQFSFVGFSSNPQPLYEQASIFLMTSRYEGLPMTLIESMQYGCVPIVFGTFSSIYDILKNNDNGVIIDKDNEQEFVKNLSMLMDDNVYRLKLSKQALKTIQEFSIKKIADKWEKMLMN